MEITQETYNETNIEINNEKKRPSLIEQYTMRDAIKTFEKSQHIELLKIIKRHTTDYTKNTNGIFVNLKDLSTEALCEIQQFVEYIQKTNEELQKRCNL